MIEDPFGAALCLILVGAFYARPLYKQNILTFTDFFRIRFSRKVELVSARSIRTAVQASYLSGFMYLAIGFIPLLIGENLVRSYVKNISDQRLLLVMRLSVVFVAICSAALAAYEGNIYDLVGESSSLSLVSLFVPLTAGLYWRRASDAGALSSVLAVLAVWIYFKFVRTSDIPSLILGGLASLFAMIIVSWLFPDETYQRFLTSK